MPSGQASGATCVQRLDDSRNSAIHTRYRISLRSSSLQEPRYPLLRVVVCFSTRGHPADGGTPGSVSTSVFLKVLVREKAAPGDSLTPGRERESTGEGRAQPRHLASPLPRGSADAGHRSHEKRDAPAGDEPNARFTPTGRSWGTGSRHRRPHLRVRPLGGRLRFAGLLHCVYNDPSAGSPTETLLRLLLPLNDKV